MLRRGSGRGAADSVGGMAAAGSVSLFWGLPVAGETGRSSAAAVGAPAFSAATDVGLVGLPWGDFSLTGFFVGLFVALVRCATFLGLGDGRGASSMGPRTQRPPVTQRHALRAQADRIAPAPNIYQSGGAVHGRWATVGDGCRQRRSALPCVAMRRHGWNRISYADVSRGRYAIPFPGDSGSCLGLRHRGLGRAKALCLRHSLWSVQRPCPTFGRHGPCAPSAAVSFCDGAPGRKAPTLRQRAWRPSWRAARRPWSPPAR